MGCRTSRAIQRDWEEYGAECFVFEVLESVDPTDEKVLDLSEELRVLEELWLEKLQPYGERGYNPAPRIDA